jgi:hypothetical protein
MVMWIMIALIIVTGAVHVIDAPDALEEAAYKGWLFYANGAAALAAVWGVYRRQDWGWNLGLMVAAGSLAGYVASRTVGLPMIPAEPDAWFEPLGVMSMIAEAGVIAVFVHRALSAKAKA